MAFSVSRLMEFCTKRELQNQTGHSVYDWPLVVLKELMDNALDACEEAEVAPVISIAVRTGSITIQDNGGGIEADTIKSILDYTIRVSSREAYVSPTRGAQGNALKTILAMGYVLDREREDATHQRRGGGGDDHRDPRRRASHRVPGRSRQQPAEDHAHHDAVADQRRDQDHDQVAGKSWRNGQSNGFKQLAESYVWFNPHLTLRGTWLGREFINVAATNPNWEKWRPRNPTSAHWYDEARLQRYLAAHVARDRDLGQPSHGAGVHRRISRALRDRRSAQDARRGRLLAPVVGAVLRRRSGQPPRHRQAAGGDAASTASRSPRSISASSAPSISSSGSWRRAATSTRSNIKCARASTDDGIPYVIEFAFGLHQSGLTQGAAVSAQVRHRRQLERGDQQPVPRFRINRRRAGEHAGQGAGQRQPAGDLRAAPGVGVHPVRGPRQKLDHPHRRRGAAR